jgi:hypothetical protein
LLAVSLLSVCLALGKNTPLFPWLYRHIPTFSLFQAPARYLVWIEFSLALLGGIGVHRWRRPAGKALYWTRLGTMAAFAIIAGAGVAWLLFTGSQSEALPAGMHASFFRAAALAGGFALLCGLLSLKAPEGINDQGDGALRTRWSWGVVLLVMADLLLAGWGLNPGIDSTIYQADRIAMGLPVNTGGLRLFVDKETEQALKFQRFLRFDPFQPAGG